MAKRAASPIKTLWSNFLGQLRNLVTRFGHYFVHKPLSSILWLAVLFAVLQVVHMAIWADAYPQWVGFGAYDEEQLGPRAKTLWDWMELLLVPGTLAAGAFLLNRWQKQNEIELENDRQRQAMLEAFFDKMSELLLEYDLREDEIDEAQSIARTRTLALFRVLDGERKGDALQFLYESGLIFKDPIIELTGANLQDAHVSGATLIEADLSGTDLTGADLSHAHLTNANLGGAVLPRANLRNATLSSAYLEMAVLEGADLRKAALDNAVLEGANLRNASTSARLFETVETLEYATMPDGSKHRGPETVEGS